MKTKSAKSGDKLRKPVVGIIMGSDSDWSVMKSAKEVLDQFDIPAEARVISAHRTPEDVARYGKSAREAGIQIIIAGAGGAAHLPGMVASYTTVPVIGVPVSITSLGGVDALYSIVQMPRGIPVATVAIDNSWNAGLLAVQILASGDSPLAVHLERQLQKYREKLARTVREKSLLG